MVHALEEASRVVSLDGSILDIRPLATDAVLEVTSPEGDLRLGEVSGAPGLAADFACRRALGEALGRGWMVEDAVSYLRFGIYWDSLADLRAFWAVPRSRREAPSESMFAAVGQHLERLGNRGRVRVEEILRLTRYRKRAVFVTGD